MVRKSGDESYWGILGAISWLAMSIVLRESFSLLSLLVAIFFYGVYGHLMAWIEGFPPVSTLRKIMVGATNFNLFKITIMFFLFGAITSFTLFRTSQSSPEILFLYGGLVTTLLWLFGLERIRVTWNKLRDKRENVKLTEEVARNESVDALEGVIEQSQKSEKEVVASGS